MHMRMYVCLGEHFQEDYAKNINPFKLVPVIHDDGFVLPERYRTCVICFMLNVGEQPYSVTSQSIT